jgi:hypothetical protein
MSDWIHAPPLGWIAGLIFGITFLIAVRAQQAIIVALEDALEARRRRNLISQSEVSQVKRSASATRRRGRIYRSVAANGSTPEGG